MVEDTLWFTASERIKYCAILNLNILGTLFRVVFSRESSFIAAHREFRQFITTGNSSMDICSNTITEEELMEGVPFGYPVESICHNLLLRITSMLGDRFVFLHGSCIADDNNGAIAFVGPSYSGKSTVALFAHMAGLRILSDDVVVVSKQDMMAFPFPKTVSLREHARKLALRQGVKFDSSGVPQLRVSSTPARLKGFYILNRRHEYGNPLIFLLKNSHCFSLSDAGRNVTALASLLSHGINAHIAPYLDLRTDSGVEAGYRVYSKLFTCCFRHG